MPSAVSEVTELQRAQLKFQRLLESTVAIPWEADAKTWRFTYVGRQAKEILGYPVDSWYEPEFWLQHIHPDDKEFAVTFCETASREKSDYDFEYRMQHADGHPVWLLDIVNVESLNGEPVVLRGYMIDISARKTAEEELLLTHVQLKERIRQATEDLANTNEELKLEIRQRKKSEKKLSQSSEHYHNLLKTISHGIEEIDTSGTIVLANPAHHRQYGYTKGELIGTSIFDHVADNAERKELREYVKYLLRKQPPPTTYVGKRRTRNGDVLDVQVDWNYLRDNEGSVTGFTSIVTDITARLKAEAALQASHDELEGRVLERTEDLSEVNEKLQIEVNERTETEEKLRKALADLHSLQHRLERENQYLDAEVRKQSSDSPIIQESNAMQNVLAQAAQVANTSSTVLILGETGVGKEVLARWIHDHSSRRKHPMIKVNCSALPASLVEAELFGREKGAYTGATSRQIGRFELADGSTIFLDEIGDLAPEIQTKLLGVLQGGEFERLGSSKTISVDVRVIAATNTDLDKAMDEKKFRSDLFYRLNVFPINVPPLRDRVEDIPGLVWTFVEQLREAMGKPIEDIPPRTMSELLLYVWPGNVRELRNVVERAMIVCNGSTLHIRLPVELRRPRRENSLQIVEREHIVEILKCTNWRVRGDEGAAALLELKPTTLEARMKKLGIHRPQHIAERALTE